MSSPDFQLAGDFFFILSAMQQWHRRLIRRAKDLGWSHVELARRADLPEENVHKYFQGRVAQPRGDVRDRLAAALGVSSLWLKEGLGPEFLEIPIVGRVTAGEDVLIPVDDYPPGQGESYLSFSLDSADPIAIEIRGRSMLPVYRPGDLLLCSRKRGLEMEACLGLDCVVRTEEDEGFLKVVARGLAPDTYTLESYNRAFPPMPNIRLKWAAPVIWVRRSERRQTMEPRRPAGGTSGVFRASVADLFG